MDLRPLPGDAAAVRAAAADLQAAIPQLRTGHAAAVRLQELLDGEHWRGEAFTAFARTVERKPLAPALERAVDAMGEAAAHLHRFAARFDDHQAELAHLRAQAAAVGAGTDPTDPAAAEAAEAELRAIERRAAAVHDDHRRDLDELAAVLGALGEEPTFAEPPPSAWDRVAGAVGGIADVAWSFGTGVVEGVRDLAVGIYELAELLLTPQGWATIASSGDELAAIWRAAVDDPLGFAAALGSALLDLDTLRDDPARWLGRRVPDLVLALATVGAGTVAGRAAASVRGVRSARFAERFLDRDPLDLSPAAAADRLRRSDGVAGRYVALGVDEADLHRIGSGALTSAETPLGRLALRVDGGLAGLPGGTALRQAPGLVLDEIRGVTDAAFDRGLHALGTPTELPGTLWMKRHFADQVTFGTTSRLARWDGLLVGAPALSPAAYAGVAAVEVLDLADLAADAHGAAQAAVEVSR